jgi:tRNA threonylcarbamoyladenosine biosynthesis protein TsaE
VRLALADADATLRLGAALARVAARRPGGVIYLEGELGAGKTTLARGLLRALGVQGTVRSPTYTLLELYETPAGDVLHMDLYRVAAAQEIEQLGLGDFPPGRTLWLVEWPQRGAGHLPPADVRICLAMHGAGREARLEASAEWQPLIQELADTMDNPRDT